MDLMKDVYKALTADKDLTARLNGGARAIRADLTAHSGRYPVIVYQMISDVPALFADDVEKGRRVTVQISIITTDGVDSPVIDRVVKDLQAIGWTRESTNRITEKDNRITAIRFVMLDTESEE